MMESFERVDFEGELFDMWILEVWILDQYSILHTCIQGLSLSSFPPKGLSDLRVSTSSPSSQQYEHYI